MAAATSTTPSPHQTLVRFMRYSSWKRCADHVGAGRRREFQLGLGDRPVARARDEVEANRLAELVHEHHALQVTAGTLEAQACLAKIGVGLAGRDLDPGEPVVRTVI